MRYEIVSITYLDGSPHERDARRRGHVVTIPRIKPYETLTAAYEDGSGILRTTRVREITRAGDRLLIETRNSLYTLRELKEAE